MKNEGLEKGDFLDQFRILRILGAGGMGEVYLALDTVGKRHVAIKVIKPGIPSFHNKLKFFLREVELYRKISHPNIVNFVASGEVDGLHYVALEHIVGISLRQWLTRNGPCPLKKAFSWTQDLVFALHAAHQRGVIHRDIKPENIMVTDDGTIKIIDFGLARTEGVMIEGFVGRGEMLKRGRPRDGRLTGDSGVIGTLTYLAPEVILGNTIGPATDIFALGLVVYEMLTGKILMDDVNTATDIIKSHKRVDNLGSFLPQSVSPLTGEFENFVQKMVKVDLQERFSSTAEMVAVLEELVLKFDFQLEDKDAQAGKKLARQELLDSHFWAAKNLFGEGQIYKGICEMEKILTFSDFAVTFSKDHIQKELDFLCVSLHIKELDGSTFQQRSEEKKVETVSKRGRGVSVEAYGFTKEQYVELYGKVLRLYKGLCGEDCLRLKIRRFTRVLKKYFKPQELGLVIHSIMAEHMGNPELTKLFIWTMESANPGVARDIWIKFIGELTITGFLLDARRELVSFVEHLGHSEDFQAGDKLEKELHSVEADLSLLEREAEEAERVTLSLVSYMVSSCEVDKALKLCVSFISKYPYATLVISKLISLYQSEKRLHMLSELYRSLGIASFLRGDTYEAIASFIKSIELDEHNDMSINFLFEIYDASGLFKFIPEDMKSLRYDIYRGLGASSLAIRELERQLTGTRSDEPIYEEIHSLAKETGDFTHVWKSLVQIGKIKMEANDYNGGRNMFDKAVAMAPDDEKEEAATSIKKVAGIRNIYSMKELAHLSRATDTVSLVLTEDKHNSMNFATLRKKISTEDEDDK
jgi:serine/threonine protein kinase/tetratricopeptide (TPR) repeat protein